MSTAQFRGALRGGSTPTPTAATQPNQSNSSDFEAFIGDLSSDRHDTHFFSTATNTNPAPPQSHQISNPPPIHSSHRQPNIPPPYDQIRDNLDISAETAQTRQDFLKEAYFPNWRDDASSADLAHPDEMQKNDPLGTQIWKLYSKTKTQLPNQERMENLTWRMMAMNLKRKEREQARCVFDSQQVAPAWIMIGTDSNT